MPSISPGTIAAVMASVEGVEWHRLAQERTLLGFRRLDDLSCFLIPNLRRADGEYHIDYELFLTVMCGKERSALTVERNFHENSWVAKLKIYPVGFVRHTFTVNHSVPIELAGELRRDLDTYTMNCAQALESISSGQLEFFETMKRFDADRFNEKIVEPLKSLNSAQA